MNKSEKKEIKKIDCLFIGIFIGLMMTLIAFSINRIKTENDCVINNNHKYITRCTQCGDILSEAELQNLYCNHDTPERNQNDN